TRGHVFAGERGSGNVLDVGLHAQLPEPVAPGKLMPPGIASDLSAVTLPVGEHLERSQLTGGIDPRRVSDEVLPSDHLIDEHVAGELAPTHRLPGAQVA